MRIHEQLFQSLRNPESILQLIGQTEELHLDCKQWPEDEKDAKRVLAKAMCGLANGDGGVLVIGLDARLEKGVSAKDEPDKISKSVPVKNALAVKSRIDNLVGELVEPLIEGVMTLSIPESPGVEAGFVVVSVPPTEGPPCRSRADRTFYLRIGTGTFPMEYFQISDMFGKRNRPKLSIVVTPDEPKQRDSRLFREIHVGIQNKGRAAAKFPFLRIASVPHLTVCPHGIDGNFGFGLPQRPIPPGSGVIFGGGADHVIHAGTTLMVATLNHDAAPSGWVKSETGQRNYCFSPLRLETEISAENIDIVKETTPIEGLEVPGWVPPQSYSF